MCVCVCVCVCVVCPRLCICLRACVSLCVCVRAHSRSLTGYNLFVWCNPLEPERDPPVYGVRDFRAAKTPKLLESLYSECTHTCTHAHTHTPTHTHTHTYIHTHTHTHTHSSIWQPVHGVRDFRAAKTPTLCISLTSFFPLSQCIRV